MKRLKNRAEFLEPGREFLIPTKTWMVYSLENVPYLETPWSHLIGFVRSLAITKHGRNFYVLRRFLYVLRRFLYVCMSYKWQQDATAIPVTWSGGHFPPLRPGLTGPRAAAAQE